MHDRHTPLPVVAGVDGSASALDAVRWAAHEALRRELPLRLVNAFDWPAKLHGGDGGLSVGNRAILMDVAHEHLQAAAVIAEKTSPGVDVVSDVVIGHPIPVFDAESRDAELLVVGDRGLGGLAGLLVGSVSVALATHAECPVVIVRGSTPVDDAAELPVIVGVGSSPSSDAAIAFAYDIAAARQVPLIAVHTWWDHTATPMTSRMGRDEVEAKRRAVLTERRDVLTERLAGRTRQYPEVRLELVVTRDHPARALLDQADRGQLVVVGSRGRHGFARLFLGSVGHALTQRASCPIAVVRPSMTERDERHPSALPPTPQGSDAP